MAALKKFHRQLRFFAIEGAVLCGGLCTGLVYGYSSPAIPKMMAPSSPVRLTEEGVSWFGSLMALGALVGGLLYGYLSDKLGRKGAIFFTCIPMTLGWLLIAYAPSILVLFIGRTLTGICSGVLYGAVPTYLIETATPSTRGFFGVSFQTFNGFGLIACAIVGIKMPWTFLAIFCAVPVILTMILVSLVPETPPWLKAHNQLERAYIAAVRLYGKGSEMVQPFTAHHMTSGTPSKVPESEHQKKETFTLATLKDRGVIIPAIYALLLVFFQQFGGISSISFNSVTIFQEADPSTDSYAAALKILLWGQIGLFINNPLVDRLGRKILLVASGIGKMIGLFTCGLYFYLVHTKGESFQQDYGWLAYVSISFYVFFYSLGFGPIPYMLIPELVPLRARGFITGTATAVSWICGFIVTKTFHQMNRALSPYGTFWFYGCICLVASIFILCFIPETKGQTLEAIEQHFKKKPKTNTDCNIDVLESQEEKCESTRF